MNTELPLATVSGSSPHRRVSLLCSAFIFSSILFLEVSGVSAKGMEIRPALPPAVSARLEKRLGLFGADYSVALSERAELLQRSVTLNAMAVDGTILSTQVMNVVDHPTWIEFVRGTDGLAHAKISTSAVEKSLSDTALFQDLPAPQSCSVLQEKIDASGIHRLTTSCTARTGYTVDSSNIVSGIMMALATDMPSVAIPVKVVTPTMEIPDLGPDARLTLLSTGRSAFKGSGEGRKFNVRKALNERVHNILVPADEEFSFNDAIANNTSLANGWREALTIFEGVNLRMAPGGGVCQASTTVFRAALRAGLPIIERKNHSLYVTYYETHGVGQEATIFPLKQNFRFKNDTGGPLVIQAYTEGTDAYVNIFGIDDGRTVTLSGPYFAGSTPDLLPETTVRSREILWVRSVERPGDVVPSIESFSSRYNSLPKSLPTKYTAVSEVTRQTMHAAASSAGDAAFLSPNDVR